MFINSTQLLIYPSIWWNTKSCKKEMKICIYSLDTCLYYKEKLSYKKHEKWDPCLQKDYHEHYKTKIQNICIEKGLEGYELLKLWRVVNSICVEWQVIFLITLFLMQFKASRVNKMRKWLWAPYLAAVWRPTVREYRLQTVLGSTRHLPPSPCHPGRRRPGSQSRASLGNLRTLGLQWLDWAAS